MFYLEKMGKKQKIKLAFIAVLSLILILALINAQKSLSRVKERREKTLASAALTKTSEGNFPYDVLYPSGEKAETSEGLYRKLEEETKDLKLARDPFNQYEIITRDISNSGSALQGIIWDEKSPKAVIDGKIVSTGDRVGGKVVLEILPDRVVLSEGTEKYELRLGK